MLLKINDLNRALSVPEVARRLGRDKATIYCWVKYGIRGVRLESFFVGGRRFVLPEAVERFVAALNNLPDRGADDDSELAQLAAEGEMHDLLD